MGSVLLIIFYFGIPLLLALLKKRFSVVDKIGVVTLSYVAGILLGNIPGIQISHELTDSLLGPVVMLSIPLLLLGTQISVFRTAGPSILRSFALCIVSITVMTTLATWAFSSNLGNAWQVGAMTFGVYTGGTVNLNAIGLALDADENTMTLLNASDLLCGGILLLFLLTAAKRVYEKFLTAGGSTSDQNRMDDNDFSGPEMELTMKGGFLSFLIAALIMGSAVGVSILIWDKPLELFLYPFVTTLGILASLSPSVRALKGSYAIGDWLINVFCVIIGSLADVRVLVEQGGTILIFVASVVLGSIILHLLLSRLFKLDAESVIIASVAGLYGPPFVPPIARAIGASALIPIGITMSLVGFAVGTYGGITLGQLFKVLFG